MLSVGLTGGVASGKSTVASLLADRGAATLDADAVVERLYAPGGAGAAAVAADFGAGLLDAAGGVDRGALGALVLADSEALRRLEATIHPLVRAAIRAWLDAAAARTEPPAVAVVEAALLVETGSYREYDRTVVVSAPPELRRRRALAAGWPAERFARTVAVQADDTRREAVADYVLRNDGDVGALAAAVAGLWEALLEDAGTRAAGRPLRPRRR